MTGGIRHNNPNKSNRYKIQTIINLTYQLEVKIRPIQELKKPR